MSQEIVEPLPDESLYLPRSSVPYHVVDSGPSYAPVGLSNHMTRTPRVTIGLPVYNGAAFLRETLDSLLAQTFEDFELVISDNGSTDSTREICREYALRDHRIRYFRNDVNLGASKNFNRVFDLACGEYFKWVADDDTIAPEFIERCLDVLEQDAGIVLAYPKALCIDEHGAAIHDYDSIQRQGPWPMSPVARFKRVFEEFESNGGASANVYSFGLVRRSVLERTSLLGTHLLSDLNLVAELALIGRFQEIPEHLMSIRAHPGSSSWFEGAGWSLQEWQDFFDPTIRSRLGLSWSLRKHHLQYMLAVVWSPIRLWDKGSLLWYCAKAPFKLLQSKLKRLVVTPLRSFGCD